MFEREQVEKILTMHGVKPTAPDEEIRAVLMGAEWHDDDINAALYVLKENPTTHQSHVDALHQVFRTDDRLQPETIKSLLGIDVEMTAEDFHLHKLRAKGAYSNSQILSIILASFVVGILFLLFGMWVMEVGVFHITAV